MKMTGQGRTKGKLSRFWKKVLCALIACSVVVVVNITLTLRAPTSDRHLSHSISWSIGNEGAAAEKGSREILVLGFHHSGTSLVVKFMQMMGIYTGKRNELLMLRGNELKYFEHKKTVNANKAAIAEGKMDHGPWWLGYGFSWDRVSRRGRRQLSASASSIVSEMRRSSGENHWVVKDPRLCLLGQEYLKNMRNPVCVIVYRDVLEVAFRMMYYNTLKQSLTIKELTEIWEQYMVNTIHSCYKYNASIVFASYEDLAKDPYLFASNLHNSLMNSGVHAIDPVSFEDMDRLINVEKFVKKHKQRRKLSFSAIRGISTFTTLNSPDTSILSPRATAIMKSLRKQTTRNLYESGGLEIEREPWSLTPDIKSATEEKIRKEAYVTMVSSDDIGYLMGAKVLAASIRRFDSRRDMVAMVTEEVESATTTTILERAGWIVKRVPKLEEPWFRKHPRCNDFNVGQVVRWGRMFSKVNLWSFDEYDQVVYSDTDTLFLRPVDAYFNLPLQFYAERSPSHSGINAGIIVTKPSSQTLQQLLAYGKNHEPLTFFKTNQVGCTEQELFNQYFHGSSMQVKLNDTRHADYLTKRFISPAGRKEMRTNGARIAHWLTTKCPKPWVIPASDLYLIEKSYTGQRGNVPRICDHKMYEIWHHYYWSITPAQDIKDNAKMPNGLRLH
mmetsp:Transcript_15040/g.17559  ORF Transcript_15040/g.17559 Transcript_15040/m.17559 type:complete len:670 (-) Transcript_15040:92-2101(-)